VAVAPDRQFEQLRQCVHDRHAHPVETARDLVSAALAKFSSGVEGGEHHLDRGPLLLLVKVNRDPAPVVGDGDRVVRVDEDLDVVALAGERLVDGVVHHLVDQVVQAARPRGSDVHPGTLAHGLEALEDRDVLRPVAGRGALPLLALALVALLWQAVPSGCWIYMQRPRPRVPWTRVGAVRPMQLMIAA
jgi:hypothetical protein